MPLLSFDLPIQQFREKYGNNPSSYQIRNLPRQNIIIQDSSFSSKTTCTTNLALLSINRKFNLSTRLISINIYKKITHTTTFFWLSGFATLHISNLVFQPPEQQNRKCEQCCKLAVCPVRLIPVLSCIHLWMLLIKNSL